MRRQFTASVPGHEDCWSVNAEVLDQSRCLRNPIPLRATQNAFPHFHHFMQASEDIVPILNDVLLHRAHLQGIHLDPSGWTEIDPLIEALIRAGKHLTRAQIEALASARLEQPLEISRDGQHLRAALPERRGDDTVQAPQAPPEYLYYPTSTRFLGAIHTVGLRSSSRRFMHLFDDLETASSLAPALGERVIVTVLAASMQERGFKFWLNGNGVWLTEWVAPEFLL